MTRYTIPVPVEGNNGEDLDALHEYVRNVLAVDFGGCTVIDAIGAWPGERYVHDEPVRLYITDQPSSDSDSGRIEEELIQLAREVRDRAGQECVYITAQPIGTRMI